MPHLGRPGIDLDEIGVSRVRVQHEIKSMHPRKLKPPNHFLDRVRHVGVFDETHHTGWPGQVSLVDHLEVKAGEYSSFPAGHRAGSLAPRHKRLRVDHGSVAKQRRPYQSLVAVHDRSLYRSGHQRRRLQGAKSAFNLFEGMDQANSVPTRGSVHLQDRRKPRSRNPFSELIDVGYDFSFRGADTFLPRQVHKCGSRIGCGKALRRSQRTLDQFADCPPRFPAHLFPFVQMMQVTGGQIVTGNDEIRRCGCDRIGQALQRHQAAVSIGPAHRSHLAEHMPAGTQGLDRASGPGQSQPEPNRWDPTGCRSDQYCRLHREPTRLASSRTERSPYKVEPPTALMIISSRSSGKRWKEILTWLTCCALRWLRRVPFTRLVMVAKIELRSSRVISVNIRPTTQSSLYQPVTSVSLIFESRTDKTLASVFRFFSEAGAPPTPSRARRKDFRERCALLLSRENMRRKASSWSVLRLATEPSSRRTAACEISVRVRRPFTIILRLVLRPVLKWRNVS